MRAGGRAREDSLGLIQKALLCPEHLGMGYDNQMEEV